LGNCQALGRWMVTDFDELVAEAARVLTPGGRFITNQVGDGEQLEAFFGAAPPGPPAPTWALDLATSQVEAALDCGSPTGVRSTRW